MNNRDRKREEKERLMEEVLGKSRSYEQIEPAKAVELSFDSKKKMEDTDDTLKKATAYFYSF